MARSKRTPSLTRLFGHSPAPIYVVNARWQIAYANDALCTWLGLAREKLVGQTVAFHALDESTSVARIAAGLCPPPNVFEGEPSGGYVSRVEEDGETVYRRGQFVPLGSPPQGKVESPGLASSVSGTGCTGVIVVLQARDSTPAELKQATDDEPDSQALHRAVGELRRRRSVRDAGAALVGESESIRRAHRQVEVAAAAASPVLVVGSDAWQRRRVAETIPHLQPEARGVAVIPFESKLLDENLLSWSLDSLADHGREHVVLLIHDLQELPMAAQEFLADRVHRWPSFWRMIATCEPVAGDETMLRTLNPRLFHWLSTLVVDLPSLYARMEDLPLLVQYLVEEQNAAGERQVAGFSQAALDQMQLFDWPGGLEQLRDAVAAAHASTKAPEIPPEALPTFVARAETAAAYPREQVEAISLEAVLAEVEIAIVRRALELAQGNKTQAASFLGMTRPRLYRRMEQLGLIEGTENAP